VRLVKLEDKLEELGCDGDGGCVGGSRDGERKVAVGRGRATYGERAACCDPAAPGGPVLRSFLLDQCGNGGAGAAACGWPAKRGKCDLAQAGAPRLPELRSR
jgi:hypothetical protein